MCNVRKDIIHSSSQRTNKILKSKYQEEIQINKRGDLKIKTRKRCDQLHNKRFHRKEDTGEELILQREMISSYTRLLAVQYEGEELNET